MPRTATKKAPTLRKVLGDLDRTMAEPAHKVRSAQIISRAVAMCLASVLGSLEFRREIGMAFTHHRLLRSAGGRILSAARSYSELSAEMRKLVADGPEKYYARALRELSGLGPGGQ